MRNIAKIIEKSRGKINPYYDIGVRELEVFYDMLNETRDFIGVVVGAFRFGYVMGVRATKAEQKKTQSGQGATI